MLKKVFSILLATMAFISFYLIYGGRKPLFYGYAQVFELYLTEASSQTIIKTTNESDYKKSKNIRGEACVIAKDVEVEKLVEDFSATILFTETIEEGTSYYCRTEKTPYSVYVNGERINLQIFIGKSQAKIGSPIIFGSY